MTYTDLIYRKPATKSESFRAPEKQYCGYSRNYHKSYFNFQNWKITIKVNTWGYWGFGCVRKEWDKWDSESQRAFAPFLQSCNHQDQMSSRLVIRKFVEEHELRVSPFQHSFLTLITLAPCLQWARSCYNQVNTCFPDLESNGGK